MQATKGFKRLCSDFGSYCIRCRGNIIDCVFYGEIFTNPWPPQLAQFVPWGEGYAGLFHGLVVDMLYFPLFSFQWPGGFLP